MNNPFKLLSTKQIYKNPWVKLHEDKVIRPGGKEGIFGVVEMAHGSSVLAVDDNQNVILIKEYKYALRRETTEVVSGSIDGTETPLEAAKRELKEETGIIAREWHDLGHVDPFTTIAVAPNYMFLAKGLINHSAPHPDEGESVTKITVPYKDALQMVNDGRITHAASCTLILKAESFLKRHA